MIYSLLFLILVTAVGAALTIWRRHERGAAEILDTVTAFFMFSFVGLAGVFAFLGHAFAADTIAEQIGWPAGNPFQFEVAVANLGYGVAGLMCIAWRGGFRWATAIVTSVFYWGASIGHIYEMQVNNNHEPGNTGPALYIDIIMPLILFGLLIAEEVYRRRMPQVESSVEASTGPRAMRPAA